jgi:hypothetical protein
MWQEQTVTCGLPIDEGVLEIEKSIFHNTGGKNICIKIRETKNVNRGNIDRFVNKTILKE